MNDFPVPERTPVNAPYWEALDAGHLVYQHCRSCGHAWLPPKENCPACLAADKEWVEASGAAKVVSWVVYHHAFHPAFAERLPYNVALVELAEGPRLLTNIVNPDEAGGIAIDAPLALELQEDHGVHLPRFRLTGGKLS